MNRAANAIGFFVHHQGRGHAERVSSIANALAGSRKVRLFCARDDIFPELDQRIELSVIPSLFEEPDEPCAANFGSAETPDTLHCAPLGWATISQAIAAITDWFANEQAALFVTDVSAELGQLARIASVQHLAVVQHGERDDPGHVASYRAAVGLLAPYHRSLEQPERPGWMVGKTIYAPGVGIDCAALSDRAHARGKLGIAAGREVIVVIGGGGGSGLPSAPLTIGARDEPEALWITLGKIASEWHETPPANLHHLGWVENPQDWISAADRIVSSCGNTTVHQVAAAARPWIVVPEWRYFNEQVCKAEALDRAGVAAIARHWPSSAQAWRKLWDAARLIEPARQRELVEPAAARSAASEIAELIERIWSTSPEVLSRKRSA